MNTNDESTNSNDKSHSHLKDSDTHSWTESTDFDAVDTSTYSEVLTSFRTYSLCSIESFSDEPMEGHPDNAGSIGAEEASGQKSQDLITHQPEAGQKTEPTLSPDEEETHNAFCPEEPMAGSSDNANSIKTEEVSTQKIRVLIANNTATQPAKSVPKSRQIVHEANQSLDFINPLITGVALVSSALLMAHPDSGLIHIVVDDSLAVASAIRPIPAIVNTGLDSVQSVYHDYDSHAGLFRQTQLGITMLANLLRVPSAILSDVGTKALPAANPAAVGLGTAATALGFAANALGCIASVIGIYYFSYKIYQVNKHAEALRRWADELLIFERVLKRLENAQALGEIKNEELASIKTGLIRALAQIEAQDEYKKAWVDLIKQSENIKQLIQNIHNGLSIVSGFVGNNTLAIENDDKLIKLQQAARQEPKLQVLNKVVKQDPKLENMRTGFTKLQNAPASNINQFKREIAFTRRQAELDIDKKHFEYDRCKFWLGVTVVGLAVSVTFLTLSCLALANPAFSIPIGVYIATGALFLATVVAIRVYQDLTANRNKQLEDSQEKLTSERENLKPVREASNPEKSELSQQQDVPSKAEPNEITPTSPQADDQKKPSGIKGKLAHLYNNSIFGAATAKETQSASQTRPKSEEPVDTTGTLYALRSTMLR